MFMNGRGGAVAVVVERLGGEVLAGAALAGQQHRRRRARGDLRAAAPCSAPHRRATRRRCASRPYGCACAGAQLPDLAAQPRRLERLLDQQRDFVEVERLVGVVVRAELHRLDGGVDGGTRSAG